MNANKTEYMCLAIDRLLTIWESNHPTLKRGFSPSSGCVDATERMHQMDTNKTEGKKKAKWERAKILQAVLNKFWKQKPTKHQLYDHSPPISQTIQVRRTRHVEHCWGSKNELISNILVWTSTNRCANIGQPARTYVSQAKKIFMLGILDRIEHQNDCFDKNQRRHEKDHRVELLFKKRK